MVARRNESDNGLRPGIRTGVKVAVVDATGKLAATHTVYPFEPRRQYDQAIEIIHALCKQHNVGLVSVGNGTASRETDRLVADVLQRYPGCKAQKWSSVKLAHRFIQLLNWPPQNFLNWMYRCAVRCLSPVVCKTLWQNWLRSIRKQLELVNIGMMSAKISSLKSGYRCGRLRKRRRCGC